VIYGGRNDQIYGGTNNVALNDINIFNSTLKQWCTVALYGMMPCSRWSHVMVPNKQEDPDGFVILGGQNLYNYCKSKLCSFKIINFGTEEQLPTYKEIQQGQGDKTKRSGSPGLNID
jgi:hypothetical protein